MSQGIPCCKTFTIAIGCVLDCGAAPQNPADLVWTVVPTGNTGNGTWSASASGASGSFSMTGSSPGGYADPGASSDGYISCPVCNSGPAKTFRFSFSVNYDVEALASLGDSGVFIVAGTDELSPVIWYVFLGGPPPQSGSTVVVYDVSIPACTNPTTIVFRLHAGETGYTAGPNSYSMNGTFTVAVL